MESFEHLITTIAGGFSDKVFFHLPLVGTYLGHQIVELTKVSSYLPPGIALITSVISKMINHRIDLFFFKDPAVDSTKQLRHLTVTVLIGAGVTCLTTGFTASSMVAGASIGTIVYVVGRILRSIAHLEQKFLPREETYLFKAFQEADQSSKKLKTVIGIKVKRNEDRLIKIDYLQQPHGHGWARGDNDQFIYANNNKGFIEVKPLVIGILTEEIKRLEKTLKLKKTLQEKQLSLQLVLGDKYKDLTVFVDSLERRVNDLENALRNWNDVGEHRKYTN